MSVAQKHVEKRQQNTRSRDAQESRNSGIIGLMKVQRTCVHDGPGIRTTLFFRGCNLRCQWCQNPEAMSFQPDREHDVAYSVSELVELVLRDVDYYRATGGGVTLSGGDPLLQRPDKLIPLLRVLRQHDLHIAAETSLHVPEAHLTELAPFIDLFLVDVKGGGELQSHRRCTGQDSELIRSNIGHLVQLGANIRFRMVVVPGWNDSFADIEGVAALLKSHQCAGIELLKYHHLYDDKAQRLGLRRPELGITDEQAVAALKEAVRRFGELGIVADSDELLPPRHKARFPDRVHAIQDAIRGADHSLCFEVSKLKTQFYKTNGFQDPPPVHRSKRLDYVLRNKQIVIYPHELIVGNFTSKRRGAQVWEEHNGVLMALVLPRIHRQKPVAFQCSWGDRLDFALNTMPFWWKRCLFSKVVTTGAELWANMARSSELVAGFNNNLASIAHYVVNYERVLTMGTQGLLEEIQAERQGKPQTSQSFYDGVSIALHALEAFADRYASELQRLASLETDPARKAELSTMASICGHVPRNPARTYHEALQSMMFLHIALCVESFENAVSPGRLDQILYPYYQRDLAQGHIDFEKAKELLALFVLKLDEAILVNDGDTYFRIGRLFETMSTDQTITAGGLAPDGRDATNDLTYALLDICELQPYAANMAARIHPGSPQKYMERLAEVYLNGAPMPALYNDEIYLDTLQRHYGTGIEQVRNYAIVGCVEPNASDDHYGNTDCANVNVVLPLLQALNGDERDLWNADWPDQIEKAASKWVEYNFEGPGRLAKLVRQSSQATRKVYRSFRAPQRRLPRSMDELLAVYQQRLNLLTNSILADHQKIEAAIRKDFPTPLASSLFPGAIKRGIDVNDGGASVNSSGIQAVGITDAADSLHALDQVVFKRGLFSLDAVLDAMEHDFTGEVGQQIRNALLAVPKFGQDDSPEAVNWVNRTLQIFVNALKQVPNCPRSGIYAAGYYALNVSDVYGKKTPSLPSGRLAGVPLANSVAPHFGMPVTDLLSSLNSVAGVDFASYAPNGTTVTFTVDSTLFQGPEGVKNLASVFKTFFKKGGMQFQPNVISRGMLLDALHHPEKYPYLLVRVAGYCAYFNDLSDDLKQILINRTCYG